MYEECKTIKELLCDESRWTKGSFAKDSFGKSTNSFAENAVCWCLVGAINKIYRENSSKIVNKVCIKLIDPDSDWLSLAHFNDDPSIAYKDVMKIVEELGI